MSLLLLTLAELCRKINKSYNHLHLLCSFKYIRIVDISYTALLVILLPPVFRFPKKFPPFFVRGWGSKRTDIITINQRSGGPTKGYMLTHCRLRWPCKICLFPHKPAKMLVLMYTDDPILIADSEENLQKDITCMETYSCKWKLIVNKKMFFLVKQRWRNTSNSYLIRWSLSYFKYMGWSLILMTLKIVIYWAKKTNPKGHLCTDSLVNVGN